MRAALLAAILAAAIAACRPAPPAAHGPEALAAENGRPTGTLYRPEGERPPGILLLPGHGLTRDTWTPVAEKFRFAGYLTLALDLPGQSEPVPRGLKYSAQDWLSGLGALRQGLNALKDNGADPENLFVMGEDLGGTLALHLAVEAPEVQGVILVSPGLEYQGIETEVSVRRLLDRPILLITAENDAYSAASANTLKAAAPTFSELRSYAGSAHGVNLLLAAPNAVDQTLQWLETISTHHALAE